MVQLKEYLLLINIFNRRLIAVAQFKQNIKKKRARFYTDPEADQFVNVVEIYRKSAPRGYRLHGGTLVLHAGGMILLEL